MASTNWLRNLRSIIAIGQPERPRSSGALGRRLAARCRPQLEVLEERLVPSSFYQVISTADNTDAVITAGHAGTRTDPYLAPSLRSAITAADANAGSTIDFAVPTTDANYHSSNGSFTFSPTSALPSITAPGTILDGYSQSGAMANTLLAGDNATLLIELNGTAAGNGSGLVLLGGRVTVQGLVINGFRGDGIFMSGASDSFPSPGANVIQGNFIGTNVAGTAALGNGDGVTTNSDASTIGGTAPWVRNLISGNNQYGVHIAGTGARNNLVQANFIGTDINGTAAVANVADGVRIESSASGNTVGGTLFGMPPTSGDGTLVGAGNLISGNGGPNFGDGGVVMLNTDRGSNTVQGNFIGVNAAGTAALGNSRDGVDLLGQNVAPVIGGPDVGNPDSPTAGSLGNLISGNGLDGILIAAFAGPPSSGARIQGNYIGVGLDGVTTLGNAGNGVELINTSNNLIGAADDSTRSNLIRNNGGTGVVVKSGEGPSLGTGISIGDSILGNDIALNKGLGIDLGADGVTANHTGSATGANDLQNYPVLTSAATTSTTTTITGTLTSAPGAYRLEFFASPTADASGHGQGQRFLGSSLATIDSSGTVSFSAAMPAVAAGWVVSATATITTTNRAGAQVTTDTSEFSTDITPVLAPDLQVSISLVTPNPVKIYQGYSYTITVLNAGRVPASNVVLAVTTGSGATYASAATSGTVTTTAAGAGIAFGNLAAGASVTATISDTAAVVGSTSDTAVASETEADANPADNTARVTESITQADQTISFGPLAGRTYGDAPFTVSATASSGLPVAFSIKSGSRFASITSSGTVTILGPGAVTVEANQAGNVNYNAAPPVDQPFTIVAADLQVSIGPVTPNPVQVNQGYSYTITVHNAGTLPASNVVLVVTTGSGATYASAATSGTVTATATGASIAFGNLAVGASVTATISDTAAVVGSTTDTAVASETEADANPADNTARVTESIIQADQTISFGPLADRTVGDPSFTVSATATSGLPVTFSIKSGSSFASITSSGMVTILGPGTVTVEASQPGSTGYYNAAPVVDQSFNIKLNQTISFGPLADKTYFYSPPFPVSATATSGLPVTFSIKSGPATVSGNTVTLTGAGTVTVEASQPGSSGPTYYNAAPVVDQSFSVAKPGTSMTVSSSNSTSVFGQGVTFTATVMPGVATGTVTFLDGTTSLGTITLTGRPGQAALTSAGLSAGPHRITASYSGDANFLGSTAVLGGTITVVAGAFGAPPGYSGDGGLAIAAQLDNPNGIAADAAGDLFLTDSANNVIRKVSAAGIITTVAGNGSQGFSGDGGPATAAQLTAPRGIAADAAGDLFFADGGIGYNTGIRPMTVIREVSAAGIITTVAGNGTAGYSGDGGPAAAAELYDPQAVAVDAAGDLFIADTHNHVIREVRAGIITTVAGNGTPGYSGDGGAATAAQLSGPTGVAVDAAGDLFLADPVAMVIREVSPAGTITTVAGYFGAFPGYSGDGGPATAAQLDNPQGVAVDAVGDLFIADTGNNVIRQVRAGIITTVAGTGTVGYSGDNGPATAAQLFAPPTVAVDAARDLFIDDSADNVIREVSPGQFVTQPGTTTTVTSSSSTSVSGQAVTFTATVAAVAPATGTPTGRVRFMDGDTPLGGATLTSSGQASFTTAGLSVGTHLITATYLGDADFTGTSGTTTQQVNAVNVVNLQQVLATTSSLTFQVDPTSATPLYTAVNGLSSPAAHTDLFINLAGGTYTDGTLSPRANIKVTINADNGTFYAGHSPAFIVTSGTVIINNVTFLTATDAPTILVTGGILTLRNDVVQESTGFSDAAILVTGGTVDLGTTASPGGNTLNVNGAGQLIMNTTSTPGSFVGDTFEVNGTVVPTPFLSTTTLASSVNPSILNQPVSFTATVQVPGGMPTGSVDFVDTTTHTDLGTVLLSSGTARLTVSSLGAGNHVIAATYSGDVVFLASSARLTQAVHYNFSGFIGPLLPNATYKLGRVLPIKFQLSDFAGKYVGDLGAVKALQIRKVDAQGQPLSPPSNPLGAGCTGLRYDPTANQFVFNWDTKGLDSGYFEILLTLADGTVQTLSLQLR